MTLVTSVWGEVTYVWGEVTFGWGEVTGGEMTMGRNDRIPWLVIAEFAHVSDWLSRTFA